MTEPPPVNPVAAEMTQPTVGESFVRLWEQVPSLGKALILALGALLTVLVPANALISTQLFTITTDNLRVQHQKLLAEVSDQIESLITAQAQVLLTLVGDPRVQACAPTGCRAEAEAVFEAALRDRLNAPGAYFTEISFLDLKGGQTARALRGIGGAVEVPGDLPPYSAHAASLQTAGAGQVYVFAIARDARITLADAYQMPVLRFAMPVFVNNERQGYVSTVINLDDFFAQGFVFSEQYEVLLLDAGACLVASSDDTRRAELYHTWAMTPDRTCYTHLPLQEWDVTAQPAGEDVFSTKVLHGPLTTSGQRWTLLIRQPLAAAYAQANMLQALLTAAHVITGIMVAAFIFVGDRATQRLKLAEKTRQAAHARDTRFNPFVFGPPIEDPKKFFGRTRMMAEVIGMGVMGGSNVIISGDPFSGKTSFLRRLESRLRNQQIPDPLYVYWPVWMDVQGVTADMFYRVLMEHILRRVEDHEKRTDLRFHKNPPSYPVKMFREDVNEIIALPDGGSKEKRLVLCLDNFDYWFSREAGSQGFTTGFRDEFRDVFQDVGTQLRVIATGKDLPREAFDPTDAFLLLGPLENEEARRLVREPIADSYEIEDEALDHLIAHSDRLPGQLQRLARYAVQFMLDEDATAITVKHVARAVDRALEDVEPGFRQLWYGGATPPQRWVEPLTGAEKSALLNAVSFDGVVALLTTPAGRFAGATFTDGKGNLRLTRLFLLWLQRAGKV
jgi:hypothetical protein